LSIHIYAPIQVVDNLPPAACFYFLWKLFETFFHCFSANFQFPRYHSIKKSTFCFWDKLLANFSEKITKNPKINKKTSKNVIFRQNQSFSSFLQLMPLWDISDPQNHPKSAQITQNHHFYPNPNMVKNR